MLVVVGYDSAGFTGSAAFSFEHDATNKSNAKLAKIANFFMLVFSVYILFLFLFISVVATPFEPFFNVKSIVL
jgi:hypothetical protein